MQQQQEHAALSYNIARNVFIERSVRCDIARALCLLQNAIKIRPCLLIYSQHVCHSLFFYILYIHSII